MKKIMIALALALAMGIGLCACDSSDSGSQEEETTAPAEETAMEETTSAAASNFAGSSYDELAEHYHFKIDGKEYALPCTISEFIANGWYIPDDYMDHELEGNTQVSMPVYNDSSMEARAFSLEILNRSEETKTIKDCDFVCGISLMPNDSCSSGVRLMKQGIVVDISSDAASHATMEALAAYYGTDEDIYSGTIDGKDFNCRWYLCHRVEANLNIVKENYQKTVAGEDQITSQNNAFMFYYNGPLE